jgi:predicted nucleic acid-binding protein
MILVDSSIYIDWLRRRTEPHLHLEPWIRSGRICICGPVRVEVLRGVIDPRQRDRVAEFFDLLDDVPITHQLWSEAAELAWKLDRKGRVLPLTDIVIAACAVKADAVVVTRDPYFSHIPGLDVRSAMPAFDE